MYPLANKKEVDAMYEAVSNEYRTSWAIEFDHLEGFFELFCAHKFVVKFRWNFLSDIEGTRF